MKLNIKMTQSKMVRLRLQMNLKFHNKVTVRSFKQFHKKQCLQLTVDLLHKLKLQQKEFIKRVLTLIVFQLQLKVVLLLVVQMAQSDCISKLAKMQKHFYLVFKTQLLALKFQETVIGFQLLLKRTYLLFPQNVKMVKLGSNTAWVKRSQILKNFNFSLRIQQNIRQLK